MRLHSASTEPKGMLPIRKPYALDSAHAIAKSATNMRFRFSSA
jgi:hypothetical protein